MIKDIREVNFPKKDGKQYATLTTAQVSLSDMGDKVITTTVKIDGNIAPDFSYDWEIEFQGEKYIHPLRKPQASKDNEDIRSSIDLTFRHWAIVELQRYFFVEMTSIDTGTAIADKYIASLSLTLSKFKDALNKVLAYWYGDKIRAELYDGWDEAPEPTTISISYSTVWDVLIQLYELYACRWQIVPDPQDHSKVIIQLGYPTTPINHIFEYGFKGGLLKVERQVQSDDIRNVLLGRGGEKNVPYRYFKKLDKDNPTFKQDPDWIPELANIYFDRIRDAAFRSYVQGWKYAHRNDTNYDGTDPGQFITVEKAAVQWAYIKGFTDKKFDPVEFVADKIVTDPTNATSIQIQPSFTALVENGSSIDKYGVRFGALDDNDEIYPTLQGVTIDPYGRIDQVVSVGEVVANEDAENSSSSQAEISEVKDIRGTGNYIEAHASLTVNIPIIFYGETKYFNNSATFTVPEGKTANFLLGAPQISAYEPGSGMNATRRADYGKQVNVTASVMFTDANGTRTNTAASIPAGEWTAIVIVTIENTSDKTLNITVSYPSSTIQIGNDPSLTKRKYAKTFDIWIKNVWNTSIGTNETPEQYAERVWRPILGDRDSNEARVVFANGLLSISEDYEFAIIGIPAYDASHGLDGVRSHWRLTLACSDADYDTLGVLVPNQQQFAQGGDLFYFIGIDLPYLYYTEAEKRLTAYKQDELAKIKDINPTWVVNLDKVRIGRAQDYDVTPLLEQLRIGASILLTDPRFLQTTETLYIQSITYNYNEPSKDDPYIVPDVEIVLSDSYSTTANPVSTIQGDVSALQKQIGSISNIEQIVRIVGDRLYLRKDGISDLSYSPTKFNSLVTSKDFRMGNIGGAGWGFYRDANGNAVIEIDRAIIRQDMEVNNLVINQITARGGMIIESAAAMECTLVVENKDSNGNILSYLCYFDQKQGTVANLFITNDVAYCNRWDADNTKEVFYKRAVVGVGDDYIELTNQAPYVNGSGIPSEGDVIVQYGNYTDKNRQFVIIRDVVGGGYERFLEGLDSVHATGTEYYFVGRQQGQDPRFFIGKTNGGYMEWTPSGGLVVKGSITSIGSGVNLDEAMLNVTSYYLSWYSNTNAPAKPTFYNGNLYLDNWSTEMPEYASDMYIWQCDIKQSVGGIYIISDPVCISARDGEQGQGVFKSFAFYRGMYIRTPQGGSYSNPIPNGWSDGIPADDGNHYPVYMTSRVFTSDGKSPQETNWSTPQLITDTSDIDFEFSSVENPKPPEGHPNTNTQWSNTANENTIWMAVSKHRSVACLPPSK